MKHTTPKAVLGLAVALASSSLLASGLTINEQSISAMGTGFAGRSSSADDASTIYGNPAGMARLKQEQVSAGAALLGHLADIHGIEYVYTLCSYLPLFGVLAILLPRTKKI